MDGLVLFSREHDRLFNQLHIQHLVCMTVAPRKPGKLPGTLALAPVHHIYSPFYLDVMHVRKDTSPSAFFVQLKMVQASEQE